MEAVRCTECGETRWSLLPGSIAHALESPCELCGGKMVIERRRPGAGPETLRVERRRAAFAGRISGRNSSELSAR
jgi:DNA-directed RNA polymerase subunit RPC12/RpoP